LKRTLAVKATTGKAGSLTPTVTAFKPHTATLSIKKAFSSENVTMLTNFGTNVPSLTNASFFSTKKEVSDDFADEADFR
jgi:hypothetical protein